MATPTAVITDASRSRVDAGTLSTMRFRSAQVVAALVALVVGAWAFASATQLVERAGGEPPGSVLVAWLVGGAAAIVTYALLHEGPRGVPLALRVRNRRGRR